MEFEITNPLIYAGPFFVALIALEIYLSVKHEKHLYQWKDLAASTSMGLGATVIAGFYKIFTLALFWAVYEVFNPENPQGERANILGYAAFGWAWTTWLVCQVLDDFNYYWHHRLSHTVRILWAAHIVHHSSENFNLGTAIRNGWFTVFYKPVFWLWLPAIGFHPIMVMTCLGIQAVYQFGLHTQAVPHLGFIEKIFNTPALHQVHHSCNLEYLDKNHGGFLNVFDRIFGTYKPLDKNVESKFGVIHPPHSYNPLVIVSHEFSNIINDVKKVKSWKHKLMYVFGEPGWSHDKSTLTAKEMKQALANGKKIEEILPGHSFKPLKTKPQEAFV